MLNPMRAAVCDATVYAYDRTLGGVWLPCQLAAEHGGFHSHAMTACEPRAELVWFSEPDLSGSEVS